MNIRTSDCHVHCKITRLTNFGSLNYWLNLAVCMYNNNNKLKEAVSNINMVLGKVKLNNISQVNDLIYGGAAVVTEMVGMGKKPKERGVPWWRRRLENQVKQLNKDLSRINNLIGQKTIKKKHRDYLQRKYRIKQKSLPAVREEIKQRIVAKTGKIKRYQQRINQFQQNRMFINNEGRFYQHLNGASEHHDSKAPDAIDAINFWSDIWGKEIQHNKEAEWLKNFRSEVGNIDKQRDIVITSKEVKSMLKTFPNWKAPGPDGVQGYWLKNFVSLHSKLAENLNHCLETGETPAWMTIGRTVLIQKDHSKGTVASNYRPITCLPLAWKLLTGIVANEVYTFLEGNDLFPEEQKGCRRNSKGTADLLFIDKMLLKEVKFRKRNLAMGWIDYRKAYDMLPHSWILECLVNLGINGKVQILLQESMKRWKVKLTCGKQELGEVSIKRGIFQGDALSPLLFVIALIPLTSVLRNVKAGYSFVSSKEKINHLLFMDDLKLYAKSEKDLESLIQTVRIFSEDIGMEFGLDKCAVMIMKRGKQIEANGIRLPDEKKIRSLKEDESYKYLGVLEADDLKRLEMKEIIKKEYKRRVRKVLETKLNGHNLIKAINTWAVAVIRYSAPFLDWNKDELQALDRRTRKLMTMHKALHPKSNVDRLYVPRKEGGRGLISVADVTKTAILGLQKYIQESEEKLISAARKLEQVSESAKEFKSRRAKECRQNWIDKAMHGQFIRQTEAVAAKETWAWLSRGGIKRETETLILAAQEQAIRTNQIKAKIDRTQEDCLCRMCKQADETVNHLLSECSKMAQREFKKIHWEVCLKYGFDVKRKWYEHEPETTMENDISTILWDFNINTDHVIQARRPDLVIKDKLKNQCLIVDFAIPSDSRIETKEYEKLDKYQDLARELKKLWNMNVRVIPIIIGALGTIPKDLHQRLKEIGIETKIVELQKTVILNSARILRKVLEF